MGTNWDLDCSLPIQSPLTLLQKSSEISSKSFVHLTYWELWKKVQICPDFQLGTSPALAVEGIWKVSK